MKEKVTVCFYCFYETNYTKHYMDVFPDEIMGWMRAYAKTHPACVAISVKFWRNDIIDD